GIGSGVIVRFLPHRPSSPLGRGDRRHQRHSHRRTRCRARRPSSSSRRSRPHRRREDRSPMIRFNLSALAVRERAVTLFLILAVAVAGAYAFFKPGRAEDPSFPIKVLTVTTAWPGATAQEMQDLVAEPLEKRLQELRWYDRVETIARPGL